MSANRSKKKSLTLQVFFILVEKITTFFKIGCLFKQKVKMYPKSNKVGAFLTKNLKNNKTKILIDPIFVHTVTPIQ